MYGSSGAWNERPVGAAGDDRQAAFGRRSHERAYIRNTPISAWVAHMITGRE